MLHREKKHRYVAVNTTVSFKSEDEVEMIVQTQTDWKDSRGADRI